MSYTYTPADTYWGQLSGCLEAIHAGTTTVLDHAHIAYSAEHGKLLHQAINDTNEGVLSEFRITWNYRLWNQVNLCLWGYSSSHALGQDNLRH